jgi:hypothetical protein
MLFFQIRTHECERLTTTREWLYHEQMAHWLCTCPHRSLESRVSGTGGFVPAHLPELREETWRTSFFPVYRSVDGSTTILPTDVCRLQSIFLRLVLQDRLFLPPWSQRTLSHAGLLQAARRAPCAASAASFALAIFQMMRYTLFRAAQQMSIDMAYRPERSVGAAPPFLRSVVYQLPGHPGEAPE